MTDAQRVVRKQAQREGSERPYYACRWVCQKNAEQCFGYFTAKDVGTYPCPLSEKCLTDKHPGGQLERKFPLSKFGKLISDTGGLHRKEHHDRMKDLHKAFFPEKEPEYQHTYYVKNKEGKKQKPRLHLCDLIPGYIPMNAIQIPPPPCGGDCEENCPYDGECRYPDWDEEHSRIYVRVRGDKVSHESREAMRRAKRRSYKKRKEKMANDPVFAAEEREKDKKKDKKRRAKVKFVKAGGTPARFEALWAKTGGDPEVFKTMTEQQEEGRT